MQQTPQRILVYMTAETPEEAERIAADLVENKLAACVNILSPITAVFRWDGKVRTGTEIAFIAKTASERFDELAARVKQLHSYDVPCIVALPMTHGDPAFLNWITKETTS